MVTIREAAHKYVAGIMRSLREHEYNPLAMKLWFMGGGACLIHNFAERNDGQMEIIDDIQATVKGYQRLAEKSLQKRGLSYEK